MHPRIAELIDYVAAQRLALLDAVESVPEGERDLRVSPDRWSVAEVLEHLHRVESGVARLFAKSVERARAAGIAQERETSSLLGSLDSYGLTRKARRLPAPDLVAPRGEYDAAQAIEALSASRQALLTVVREADGLALCQISFPHPLLGSLNLYQWVLFVGQHEARHADQIQEIGRGTRAQ